MPRKFKTWLRMLHKQMKDNIADDISQTLKPSRTFRGLIHPRPTEIEHVEDPKVCGCVPVERVWLWLVLLLLLLFALCISRLQWDEPCCAANSDEWLAEYHVNVSETSACVFGKADNYCTIACEHANTAGMDAGEIGELHFKCDGTAQQWK